MCSCVSGRSSSLTSTDPDQSSGGSASCGRIDSHRSGSASSTVPSKYCSSIVPANSSTATTSNNRPLLQQYQRPICGDSTPSLFSLFCDCFVLSYLYAYFCRVLTLLHAHHARSQLLCPRRAPRLSKRVASRSAGTSAMTSKLEFARTTASICSA